MVLASQNKHKIICFKKLKFTSCQIVSYTFRIQKSSENDLFIPLSDSKIGLFSTKTFKIETELNPKSIQDSACLGLVMGIKPCIDEYKYVLVMYDGGLLYLWDVRAKNIVSSLEVEKSPMSIDFSSTLKHGIIGSPSNHLEARYFFHYKIEIIQLYFIKFYQHNIIF